MKTAATEQRGTIHPAKASRRLDLRFLAPLLLIAAAALAIRIYVGSLELMDFDEWQQVFMADGPRLKDLAFELHREAHPPFFYLLLRWLILLGHDQLLYRMISILPGTGAVLLMGGIGRKVFRSGMVALLCAAALAFSTAAITISTEVRQYQLAVFLVLLAFSCYLFGMLSSAGPVRTRDYVVFSAAAALAVASQYSSIVFLGACIAAPLALAWLWPDFRNWLAPALRGRRPRLLAWSLGAPIGLFAIFYFMHARRQPIMGYLYDFYWGWGKMAHESVAAFLLRNLQNFWNLFSPVPIHARALFVLMFALVCAGSAYILVRTRNAEPERGKQAAILAAFAAAICVELATLGVAQSYPFGGLLRHQYVAGPFLILAAFAVLDRLLSVVGPKLRAMLLVLAGAAVAANLAVAWPTLVRYPGEVVDQEEFSEYHALFPRARAVYLDHWGVIGYYAQTDYLSRRFVRRIPGDARIEQFHMDVPGGGVEIFYDKTRATLDLSDATVYGSFATCLKESHIPELTLFYLAPGGGFREPPDVLKAKIEALAAAQGLLVTKIAIKPASVYAGFVLR